MKTLKVEEARQSMQRLSVDSTPDLEKNSPRRKSGSSEDREEDKRSSVQLSLFSEESRRRSSLFLSEDDMMPGVDEGREDDQDGDGQGEDEAELAKDEMRRRKRDDVFVDKTRASAMTAGAKDIREALELQKKAETFRRTPEARAAATLFKQAKFLMHQSRFREALLFLDKATAVDPERKEWITEKGRCYLNILQPHATLRCVDQVLKRDPEYFQALLLKGEALYSLWDLERAMLCFVEGRRLRPENDECARGVHKVRMALDEIAAYRMSTSKGKTTKLRKKRSQSAKARLGNSVSSKPSSERSFLTSASLNSSFDHGQMNEESESNCTPVSRSSTSSFEDSLSAVIPPPSHPTLQQPRPKIQRSSTCMGPNIPKCLEQDKRFLDGILRDKSLRRSKTPYTRRVLHMAKDLKSFVSEREIYWKNREQFIRYAHGDDSDFEP
ncbi:uncharacterized protein LOC129235082 [Uloborus diversus]|uniref:uncharacterized protein LOC129235082 n=1 Tax=Uloborus diversus TaxID=327109 RepID=UPI0024098B8E|nr:uncharacterized protein LOC129235082 [Uloborus diversus]